VILCPGSFGAHPDGQVTWEMTAPCLEIDPEAALVSRCLESSGLGDSAPQEDSWRWRITATEREPSWCRLFMSQGWVRRPWGERSEDSSCKMCISRAGEYVVRDPVS
jgi:hypothetical protein